MWRKLHRWVSIVAAVYLLNMAVTGLLLGLDELSLRLWGDGPPPEPGVVVPVVPAEALPNIDLAAAAQRFYQQAQRLVPDAPMTGITLAMKQGRMRGVAAFGGARPGQITLDLVTGRRLNGPPAPDTPHAGIDYHQWLKRMHRGDFVGSFYGRYLSIAGGVCLLFLVVSSLMLYLPLLAQRRRMGRTGLFWS